MNDFGYLFIYLFIFVSILPSFSIKNLTWVVSDIVWLWLFYSVAYFSRETTKPIQSWILAECTVWWIYGTLYVWQWLTLTQLSRIVTRNIHVFDHSTNTHMRPCTRTHMSKHTANRGGGEFGREWHQAGTKERKQVRVERPNEWSSTIIFYLYFSLMCLSFFFKKKRTCLTIALQVSKTRKRKNRKRKKRTIKHRNLRRRNSFVYQLAVFRRLLATTVLDDVVARGYTSPSEIDLNRFGRRCCRFTSDGEYVLFLFVCQIGNVCALSQRWMKHRTNNQTKRNENKRPTTLEQHRAWRR